jgi:hypothetical protein
MMEAVREDRQEMRDWKLKILTTSIDKYFVKKDPLFHDDGKGRAQQLAMTLDEKRLYNACPSSTIGQERNKM